VWVVEPVGNNFEVLMGLSNKALAAKHQ